MQKIITEKKLEDLVRLDAINIVDSLFSELLERERDILARRFGLKSEKAETLEKIGNLHKLTRERVRQIEAASIKKIQKLDKLTEAITTLKAAVNDLLADHGGLMRRDYLLDILSVISLEIAGDHQPGSPEYDQNFKLYRNHFNFLLTKFLADDLELVNDGQHFETSFKKKDESIDYLRELADDLLARVGTLQKTLNTEQLLELLQQLDAYNKYQEKLRRAQENDIMLVFKSQIFPDRAELINSNKILYSLLQALRNFEQNKYGEWGLGNWSEVKPKTVNDKIYLVLKHEGAPLHFTEIARKINDMKFDRKTANPATVHNELILDSRYVLVSRGTYGLKEWQQ